MRPVRPAWLSQATITRTSRRVQHAAGGVSWVRDRRAVFIHDDQRRRWHGAICSERGPVWKTRPPRKSRLADPVVSSAASKDDPDSRAAWLDAQRGCFPSATRTDRTPLR
ncbi:hypothetical protein HPB50_007976 [Hyalomma asiaticum]|uniref:Uncharacterized protein n=1 Tax=Hyalomma asiaticum TaxID=266040 RepID=A0ACB7T6V1_HYAAI|nr:hypothetical protein HPB50_007976 [Hyalomma asiaticum]